MQPVADPGIRYQRTLPDGQGDDELGRVAVRRDKQLLLREAKGLQTVFYDNFRLVLPNFRRSHARRDGLSARQTGKFPHQLGAEGAGAVAPAPLDGAGANVAGGQQGAFIHAFRFKTAHQMVEVFLAAVFRVVAAEADEAAFRMNPFGPFGGRGQPCGQARPFAAGKERVASRQAGPGRIQVDVVNDG